MKIETKYNIHQKVSIEGLGITGKIIGIFYRTYVEYNVRFFDNASVQHEYFLEDELKPIGD